MGRTAELTRTTKETDISIALDLDGTGKTDIDTGVPFFDHMLDAFGRHGLFDLTVHAKGDIEVDAHHTCPQRYSARSTRRFPRSSGSRLPPTWA